MTSAKVFNIHHCLKMLSSYTLFNGPKAARGKQMKCFQILFIQLKIHVIKIISQINCNIQLTPSFIYTHFSFRKTLWKKMKLLKMSNFIFFHNVFYATCILKSVKSHISSASLNLGPSQNGILGNGLISVQSCYS